MKNILNNKINNVLKGENPLLSIDEEIKFYAEHNKMKLSKNHQDWPERTLSWKNKKISKVIQLYLKKEDSNNFLIWGCASKNKIFKGRYWWKIEPTVVTTPFSWDLVENYLNILKEKLEKITESELVKIP